MTTFADYYTFENFQKTVDETTLSTKTRTVFNDSLRKFMGQLVADGRIVAAPHYGERERTIRVRPLESHSVRIRRLQAN